MYSCANVCATPLEKMSAEKTKKYSCLDSLFLLRKACHKLLSELEKTDDPTVRELIVMQHFIDYDCDKNHLLLDSYDGDRNNTDKIHSYIDAQASMQKTQVRLLAEEWRKRSK